MAEFATDIIDIALRAKSRRAATWSKPARANWPAGQPGRFQAPVLLAIADFAAARNSFCIEHLPMFIGGLVEGNFPAPGKLFSSVLERARTIGGTIGIEINSRLRDLLAMHRNVRQYHGRPKGPRLFNRRTPTFEQRRIDERNSALQKPTEIVIRNLAEEPELTFDPRVFDLALKLFQQSGLARSKPVPVAITVGTSAPSARSIPSARITTEWFLCAQSLFRKEEVAFRKIVFRTCRRHGTGTFDRDAHGKRNDVQRRPCVRVEPANIVQRALARQHDIAAPRQHQAITDIPHPPTRSREEVRQVPMLEVRDPGQDGNAHLFAVEIRAFKDEIYSFTPKRLNRIPFGSTRQIDQIVSPGSVRKQIPGRPDEARTSPIKSSLIPGGAKMMGSISVACERRILERLSR